MAKQILEEERGTCLPVFEISEAAKDRFGFTLATRDAVIEAERRWSFTALMLETTSGDIRPDIIASDGHQRIIMKSLSHTLSMKRSNPGIAEIACICNKYGWSNELLGIQQALEKPLNKKRCHYTYQ